jgi:MmyB-like transcription regulator ligand binding domain
VDRELLERFLRARLEEAAPGEPDVHAAPVMRHLVKRLSDYPAVVLSGIGEVLAQTRPAIALFGDYTPFGGSSRHLVDRWLTDPAARERYLVEMGVGRHAHLRRYWHAELGVLELYRQLLVDPVDHQMLLVFTAAPGSPSAEKLRLLAAHSG